ncbi:MAG: hypothetical protein R2714_16685 [Microthrixaceae bacterium]
MGLNGERRVGGHGPGDDLGQALAWVDDARRIDHYRVVGLPATGHGDVSMVSCRGRLEDSDADVDGVALGAVAGDGQPSSTWRAT